MELEGVASAPCIRRSFIVVWLVEVVHHSGHTVLQGFSIYDMTYDM
jgi:hypothetical protein